jgi:hypothetical protein
MRGKACSISECTKFLNAPASSCRKICTVRAFISVNTTSVHIRCTLIIYYMFRSFVHRIQCWLHRSPITLANVYSGYILCCWLDTLGCNGIVTHLLRARTVEPEKQPLLGNARTQQKRNCHDTTCDVYIPCYGATG